MVAATQLLRTTLRVSSFFRTLKASGLAVFSKARKAAIEERVSSRAKNFEGALIKCRQANGKTCHLHLVNPVIPLRVVHTMARYLK